MRMPISAERTLEVFGYDVSEITPGMSKKVVCICEGEDCGVEFVVRRKNLNEWCICRKCAFKRVPREHYAEGIKQREETCLKKFDNKIPPRTEEWEANRRATFNAKYGGNSPTCDRKVVEKAKQTRIKKYEVEHMLQHPDFKKKQEDTMIERHGKAHSHQIPEQLAKALRTHRETFGRCPVEELPPRDLVFLPEEDLRVMRKWGVPVRYVRKWKPVLGSTCHFCPEESQNAAHKIPYMRGILVYGLTPTFLNRMENLLPTCRKHNKQAELSDEEIVTIVEQLRAKNKQD
jgi:hypothetical protein